METTQKQGLLQRPLIQSLVGIIAIILIVAGILVYKLYSSTVAIDLGMISAPVIAIGPEQPGILDSIYIHPGDQVTAGEALAQVGGETLYAKIAGTVLTAENVPGEVFNPGQAIVTMIDPSELRVVGTIDENKGLTYIKVGDPATFTVDAFGSTEFTGVVDEISPTSSDLSVVFSISDQRPTKQFTIKIKYDTAAHPEFKNGMSAKITVFVK